MTAIFTGLSRGAHAGTRDVYEIELISQWRTEAFTRTTITALVRGPLVEEAVAITVAICACNSISGAQSARTRLSGPSPAAR